MAEPTLYARMELRLNDFEKKLAKATKSTDTTMKRIDQSSTTMRKRVEAQFGGMTKAAAGFAKSLAAPILALGAAGAVREIIQIADSVARVGDEAKRAGLGVEAFQELKYVAEQNRVGVDALVDGFKELSLRADEFIVTGGGSAAEAFRRLGFGAEELNTKLQDPSALFSEIIGKLEHLDQAAQIRISDELFGGTGGEQFVKLISQGADGIRRTIEEARSLGIILSSETIAKADELDRKFNLIATTVSTNLKGAIVEATAALNDFIEAQGSPAKQFDDLSGRVAETTATIEQLAIAAGGAFPALEERLRSVVVELLNNRMGAEDAKTALLEMASANPDFSPIVGDLNGLISLYAMLTGQAREAANAMSLANSDPVGSGATFGDLTNTFFPKPTTVPGSGGGGAGASSAANEAAAVLKLIDALEYERTTIGLSAKELAVANALREAGAIATEEQQRAIEALVIGNFDLSAAQDAATASLEQMQGIAQDVLSGVIGDLRAGKDAADVFGNALNSVLDNLISIGLQSLTGGLFGGGGGIGKLFGFANGGIAAHGKPLPTFARGGVSRSAAIFGEAGPEAAVPLPDGRSIPVKFVGSPGPVSKQNQQGGGALTVHVSLDSDMLRAEVTNTAGQVVARAAPSIIRAANDNAPGAAAEAQLRRG